MPCSASCRSLWPQVPRPDERLFLKTSQEGLRGAARHQLDHRRVPQRPGACSLRFAAQHAEKRGCSLTGEEQADDDTEQAQDIGLSPVQPEVSGVLAMGTPVWRERGTRSLPLNTRSSPYGFTVSCLVRREDVSRRPPEPGVGGGRRAPDQARRRDRPACTAGPGICSYVAGRRVVHPEVRMIQIELLQCDNSFAAVSDT